MQQQFELTPDEYFALKSYKKAHNFDWYVKYYYLLTPYYCPL
jgi:hypothetical protein